MTTTAALPALLCLPPALRDQMCDELVVDDLLRFAATFRMPPCLKVCKQLRDEYSGVFFSDANLTRMRVGGSGRCAVDRHNRSAPRVYRVLSCFTLLSSGASFPSASWPHTRFPLCAPCAH
ncbi:uncharacterized protein MYCFIDRAFT_211819 [Pseudocercospora fijiensis CIRAD86]|uniref:F-box domain-containing protein n=1 Tax=Pseudocercospora fijiensis (strain CIRAD86) TaxID=383855 RepID=M3A9N9_PSEFD|nr:uncharacterized protein MYCFIDRAFT_211819 [Pseudocercospora fijiensis CIRAD86]EME81351.1 hypothetical protein MYCFIDRAFT_211819 [Pseudocercospora fijiensis CIRAD86]